VDGIFIFLFLFLFLFYFFLCPMAAEMRQRHAPESHATQKPRSRAPGPKKRPKTIISQKWRPARSVRCYFASRILALRPMFRKL
jgi:hypothetical protein